MKHTDRVGQAACRVRQADLHSHPESSHVIWRRRTLAILQARTIVGQVRSATDPGTLVEKIQLWEHLTGKEWEERRMRTRKQRAAAGDLALTGHVPAMPLEVVSEEVEKALDIKGDKPE